jgi:homoaconitase
MKRAGNPSFYPAPNPKPQPDTPIVISPTSSRLEVLEPFTSHFAGGIPAELPALTCLMRVRGKCTTDHISAAVSS